MSSNRHSEFNKLGDVSTHIACSIGIVYRDGNEHFTGVESVLLHKASVDGAAGAATVKQSLSCQGGIVPDRVQY